MNNKPISEQIRDRIVLAGRRYHASDNISDFIKQGEKELLVAELQEKFQSVLESLVIDTA